MAKTIRACSVKAAAPRNFVAKNMPRTGAGSHRKGKATDRQKALRALCKECAHV